jgi:hypothetical protein
MNKDQRTAAGGDGMTLRDYLAGQALTGILAAHAGEGVALPSANDAAEDAYEYADAMLAHRRKPTAKATQPQQGE